MALTKSNPFPIGTKAPDFNLQDTKSNQVRTLRELKGEKGTLIFFICNHCPYVKWLNKELIEVALEAKSLGIESIAISSNDVSNYPEDSPENMSRVARELNYPFPYLYDESQDVAKKYDAACTPDFYLFDENLQCVYHGQMDDSRPGREILPDGKDIRKAIDALLENKKPLKEQKPSIGCGIKWKQV